MKTYNSGQSAYFFVYFAPQDNLLNALFNGWVSRKEACSGWDGVTCAISIPGGLQINTNYGLYMQSWGVGGMGTGGNLPGLPEWIECKFSLTSGGQCAQPPTKPANLNVQISNGIPTLTWSASQNVSTYEVWLGIIKDDVVTTAHYQPHDPSQLGCEAGGTCTLTLINTLTSGEEYSWFLLAKGPGGVPQNDLIGWVTGPKFIVP